MPLWVKSAVTKWIAAARLTDGRFSALSSKHGTVWSSGFTEKCSLVRGSRLLEVHRAWARGST